jgi:topoisomerase-4 subunit A
MARFHLSTVQAEDILDIRLRQLARLEALKIAQELSDLRGEQSTLQAILDNPAVLQKLMIREIESDAKTFADPRRTLIQEEKRAVQEIKVVDEPVTVIISQKGWVRTRGGHGLDSSTWTFKAGDSLHSCYECRSVDCLLGFGLNGRVYSVVVSLLPGGRGDGVPITSLIELEAGTHIPFYFAGSASTTFLLSSSAGYGFLASVENMMSRQKAGKAFITCNAGETICPPSRFDQETHVACVAASGRILTFELADLKSMPNGGRGLMLMSLEEKDTLIGAVAYMRSVKITGVGRGGKEREDILEIRSLNNAQGIRGRKGKEASFTFKPNRITRIA